MNRESPMTMSLHARSVTVQRPRGRGLIPRLAGQLYPYTVKELENWDKERGQGANPDTSAVMRPIAHSLSRSQIEAVAAYLSNLE